MTFIRSEGLSSQFNADWLDKLLIGIDEALINEKVMLERLKNLATATREKLEQKGKDRRETDFSESSCYAPIMRRASCKWIEMRTGSGFGKSL
ncbi:primase-helicase family protein [Cruoricaptor ignavus]|uniref:primase-helicase family protein n=1 Tax=Cruoricaptor ignavus TaxID=1118202 RepID=UPI00370CFD34